MSTNALALRGATSIMPALTVQEASERYNVLVDFTKTVMVKDQDYGTIEGVQKPCLYKAGAEKLASLFGLAPAFELIERREDWTGRETGGEPLFYYFYKCKLYRGGELIGEADGSCNSWEKKYRFREGKRRCPNCGSEAIIKGKAEYGGGWLCFAKKGGCGAKFIDKDPKITGQVIEKVPNPDIHEIVNTIQKMAQKRALVAAVLIACNASAFYTQDVEDIKTIDVDYEAYDAQHELRIANAKRDNDARQSEIDRQRAPKGIGIDTATAGSRPAVSGTDGRETGDREGSTEDVKSPSNLSEFEQRQAKLREAEKLLNEASSVPKPTTRGRKPRVFLSFEALKSWGKLKDELRELTGSDALYYAALDEKGYKHANQVANEKDALAIFGKLGKERNRIKQDGELLATLSHASEVIGSRAFSDILGTHACETLADALALAGDPLAALLSELRDRVDERKGMA